MKIVSFPLGQLQANCYFLVDGSDCIIIDPADSADFILEEISRRNLTLLGMFATHGHFDHIMAAGEIQASLGTPFYIFKEDEFLAKRLEETARHFLGHEPAVLKPKKFSYLKEGAFHVSGFTFHVFHIPGHTPGSAAYYFKEEDALFTGDTLFKAAIGRYDFSYSDRKLLKESLDRLFELPPATIVYPGHEEITTMGDECRQNLI